LSYKDILVFLDPTSSAPDRVRLAIELAKTHESRLIGVDATVADAGEGEAAGRASPVRLMFETMTRDAQVKNVFHAVGSARDSEKFNHCVDLIVAPAPGRPAREFLRHGLLDRALMDSGAPTLILPHDWTTAPLGESVVVAWNGGREAVRAVHDAMPLLKRAREVAIFAFSSRPSALRESAEILVDHLRSHGVESRTSDWTNTADISVVEALYASVEAQGADLVVAGAFGHSRLYEGLFGGMSFDLIRQQSLPLLMSH